MTEVEANNFFFPENLVSRMNSLTGSSPYLSSQSDIKMLNDSSFERNKKNVENYTKIESSRLINIYGSDIYLYLRNIEQNLPSKSFLSKHKINPNVRTKLIDWMIEVFDAYCSETQTFFICVEIFDNFLSKTKNILNNSHVHLIGIASMFIASKFEDLCPIQMYHAKEKIGHNKFSAESIKEKEKEILQNIDFDLIFSTTFDFISILFYDFYTNNREDITTLNLMKQLKCLENISVFLAKMLNYDEFFSPIR